MPKDMPTLADLLGSLMPPCPHERALVQVSAILAVLAARQGGRIELTQDEIKAVGDRVLAVHPDGEDRLVVELVELSSLDEHKAPTHDAPRGVQ